MVTSLQKLSRSPSGSNDESPKLSRLEQLRARHINVRKETGAELAKSKERLARERMSQAQGMNWYSQRFNESGRRFFMDTSYAGGEESGSNSNNNRKPFAKKVPLETLRERHKNVMKETGAELAKSKERLARERMAQAQGMNWYSQRFNESGRRFYMDTSDTGGEASDNRASKPVAKKVPQERRKKEAGAELAKSKERLARERMAQAQGMNWYSQRFNESGRRFYMDTSDAGGEASDNRASKPAAKKVPLHVKLKKENKRLRRKLEKTESERKLLEKRVSKVGVPDLSTDKAILKTKLREKKAQYTTLELELSETKNELSQKEASTMELMEKMKQMKEAYDTLARQMQSQGGSFSTIQEEGNMNELLAEVNDLKHENKRLLLERKLSMRQQRLGSISESHLNESQGTKFSTTTLDLTAAEMRVIETADKLQDTQDALNHAQSLIEKLEREKEVLAKKMENKLDRSNRSKLDASHRSRIDSSRRSTIDTSQQSRRSSTKMTRGLSMVLNEVENGNNAPIRYLNDVDSSVSSLGGDSSLSSSLSQEEFDGDPESPETRRKWRQPAALGQDLHALNGQHLSIVNQTSIVSTSLLLISGFPSLALAVSVGSILIYVFQKDHSLPLNKDVQKHFLINCTGVIMSFGSWSLRAQAMEDPSRMLGFIFAALVRQLSGFVLAWFIYTDYKTHDYEPETLDIHQIKVKIFGGRNLVAKDRNIFGKAKSSDPYVRIYHARNYIGKTKIAWKTLNPIWKTASFTIMAVPSVLETYKEVICCIYDKDTLSADDSMGTVIVPIPAHFNKKVRKWHPVTAGSGDNYCSNASGHLDVEVVVVSSMSNELRRELHRRASINNIKKEPSRKFSVKAEKKKGRANKGGIQSLGEVTAETKFQVAPEDAIVVKI